MECLTRTSTTLDKACTIMQSYPQVLLNVRTAERVNDAVASIAADITTAEEELGENGRILVRASGTEPVVRVMVEASTESVATSLALRLANALIQAHGGALEGTH
jgi:phosphoglucosamine mutase